MICDGSFYVRRVRIYRIRTLLQIISIENLEQVSLSSRYLSVLRVIILRCCPASLVVHEFLPLLAIAWFSLQNPLQSRHPCQISFLILLFFRLLDWFLISRLFSRSDFVRDMSGCRNLSCSQFLVCLDFVWHDYCVFLKSFIMTCGIWGESWFSFPLWWTWWCRML